ncbi:MAG: asparagine synthase (glutamine-hydrolyzing) [Candidatus Thiosymbion ectosymbiont of Robbea hypermnestra]|nr:asparagine synthase (glutamine-hydrolyzing) [Candidatus Thiosymbion ectosymbiont of Robbea hypermnestra]
MCGIAGLLLHRNETPDQEDLRFMAQAMRYRGPDDEGYYSAPHIGLVHRRLSIRDLSPAGHCPMSSEDGSVQVIFNGEIYNWRELRGELEGADFGFGSQSDTEVIVQGYRVWGEDLIPRLRGMFALAIWDAARGCLLLARDRSGEKPLFYLATPDFLAFSSTLVGLQHVLGRPRIDPVAIACHLAHSFIPSSHAAWIGVEVLPPAHLLNARPGDTTVSTRYWDFPRVGPSRASSRKWEVAVENALDDSVARCLDADVPVGVFLSGGVDSSLVAALAARHRPGIEAFSLGFAEAEYSELSYARRVAEHLEMPHYRIRIDVDDVLACLPHLVMQYGQPFGDASAVPSYCVARLARQRVKVCLSGDGGDESFGGYWRMQSGVYAARYGAVIPRPIRERWIPRIAGRCGGLGRRWAAMNEMSLMPPGAGYTNAESWYGSLADLAGPSLRSALRADLASLRVGHALERPEASKVQILLYDDFQVQLPDAYLTKVDVASMAASLEVRAPFLDQRVIEMAWGMPDSMKLSWGRRKWLLKRIAARRVPPEVVYRPKMGFGMPLADWFRGKLGEVLENLLQDSIAVREGWIRNGPVTQCLHAHRKGENHATRLWLVLWLELWFRLVARQEQDAQDIDLQDLRKDKSRSSRTSASASRFQAS